MFTSFMRSIHLPRYKLEIVFILVGVILSQGAIFFYESAQRSAVQMTINSLAAREDIAANSYRFSQAIENLEDLGMIKCTRIWSKLDSTIYLDTSFRGGCESNFVNLLGVRALVNINTVSGHSWELVTLIRHSKEARLILWLVRALTFLLAVVVSRYIKYKIEAANFEKNKELEIKEALLQLARHIAHDIRAPLTALEAVVVQSSGVSTDHKELIQQAIIRIRSIADELLRRSKTERTGQVGVGKTPKSDSEVFNILDSIDRVVKEQNFNLSKIKIDHDNPSGVSYVFGVKLDFERLLSNLLQNSIEACLDSVDPQINVSYRKYSNWVQVTIFDNGKGLALPLQQRVGERGFSHGKQEGNGLGVSFAKDRLSEWGGKLTFSSVEGSGTSVTLVLRSAH